MRIFGMVTTVLTWEYTSYALKSFFRTNKLSEQERLYLIDNDQSFEEDTSLFSPYLEILKNNSPRNFAANHNLIMKMALEAGADYYILANDVIFTDNWSVPLQAAGDSLVSAQSNRNIQYERGGYTWRESLKLNEYLSKRADFKEICQEHCAKSKGYNVVDGVPFVCCRIPFVVMQKVGMINEELSDDQAAIDYCRRAKENGFTVQYAEDTFVLNFNVKK